MSGSRSPRDEDTTHAPRATATAKLSLRIVFGERVVTRELPEQGELVIGRSRDADVFIDDRSVSRIHARLRVESEGVTIEDLASANGTRWSGRSLAPHLPTLVKAGDAVELGDVVIVIQRGGLRGSNAATPKSAAFVGSPAMQEIERLIERVAPGMITILIVGETGVGKEVVAEAIHRKSRRANRPLVRLNCAAIAEPLLESEWFGHERGAFTGAVQAKPGLLEVADGGTVLLDEVGELPMGLQAKLLRVLEERAILRVGGLRPRAIDVRFVGATNRDLEADVRAGRFREDFFFRLNGVAIHVPALRDRREEIEPFARRFVAEAAEAADRAAPTLSKEARDWLDAYDWPGNIRELRNMMERAVLIATGDTITGAELPARLRPGLAAPGSIASAARVSKTPLRDAVAELEKEQVLDALARANGNQRRAAALLGISRGTLLARMDAFKIQRPRKGVV
jgi:two-component system response regulator AtoC